MLLILKRFSGIVSPRDAVEPGRFLFPSARFQVGPTLCGCSLQFAGLHIPSPQAGNVVVYRRPDFRSEQGSLDFGTQRAFVP